LIFPPVSARGDFKNGYGIFSDGVNNIIQALARKRKKGEIHILLPRPTNFNYNSFPFDEAQKEAFKHYFEPIQYQSTRPSSNDIVDRKTIDYIPLDNQNDILSNFYNNELKANVEVSISHINSIRGERTDKVRLEFPEFKLFQLEEGEKYLANKYKFLGSDLSGYVTYCAATNQFVNCNLVYTNWKPLHNFKNSLLQYCFEKFYENYFDIDWFNSLRMNVTDKYIYKYIRNEIFNNHQVKLYNIDGTYNFIKPYENKMFEIQLIAFIQRKLFRNNQDFVRRYEQPNGWIKDSEYTRGDYFRSCIAHAHRLSENENLSRDVRLLVDAYLQLDNFKNKIVESIQSREIRNIEVFYIDKTPSNSFISTEELDVLNSMCSVLCEKDMFIQNNIFIFKRIFTSNENNENKVNRFYTYLKEDFFVMKTKKIQGVDYDQIIGQYSILQSNQVLDMISTAMVTIPEENMTQLKIVDGKAVFD